VLCLKWYGKNVSDLPEQKWFPETGFSKF